MKIFKLVLAICAVLFMVVNIVMYSIIGCEVTLTHIMRFLGAMFIWLYCEFDFKHDEIKSYIDKKFNSED